MIDEIPRFKNTISLDRERWETRPVYSVLVQAWDNYQLRYSTRQSRNEWEQLSI